MTLTPSEPTLLAATQRGGYTENQYFGWWVVRDVKGKTVCANTALAEGNAVFLRSMAKPFQALPIAQHGLIQNLSAEQLALTCASHVASERHQAVVTSILDLADCSIDDLQCGSHWPLDEPAKTRLILNHQQPCPLHHNCSGKHAGMLWLCRQLGWSLKHYRDPDHPLQQEIKGLIENHSGYAKVNIATDGCGVPSFYLPITGAAALYAKLATEENLQPFISAIIQYPKLLGGEGRVDSALIEVTGGRLVAKVGADGLVGVCHREYQQGLVLKIADGGDWARNRLITHLLVHLGWLTASEANSPLLSSFFNTALSNAQGDTVGEFVSLV